MQPQVGRHFKFKFNTSFSLGGLLKLDSGTYNVLIT